MHKITIETDPSFVGLADDTTKSIIMYAFDSENVFNSEVNIIFGDKTLIQELKKEYFNLDRPTDVIAFRLNKYQEKNLEGEIYICLPVAKENAEYFGEPYEKEVARLIVHGSLHLIGYDDSTEAEQKKMHDLENKYLRELEI